MSIIITIITDVVIVIVVIIIAIALVIAIVIVIVIVVVISVSRFRDEARLVLCGPWCSRPPPRRGTSMAPRSAPSLAALREAVGDAPRLVGC